MNHTAISGLSFASLDGERIQTWFWNNWPLGHFGKQNTWSFGIQPPEDLFTQKELQQCLRFFWQELSPLEQRVFLRRYEYLDTTAEIADRFGFSQRRVRSMLHRMGRTLRTRMAAAGLA